MKRKEAERRMLKNEVVFRRKNRAVQKGLDDLVALAQDEGQEELIDPGLAKLHFFCECADENCRERIVLRAQTYKAAHANAKRFIVLPNHAIADIEKVIKTTASYSIVEKFMKPPKGSVSCSQHPQKNV
jgi:hypothetical protein